MRIAYVCADRGVPIFGTKGASVHVQEMLRAMLRGGHQPEVVCVRTGGPAPADLAHVPVHESAVDDAATARSLAEIGAVDLVYERYSLSGRAGMTHATAQSVPSVLEVNAPLIDEQARHRTLGDRRTAEAVLADALRQATVVACVSESIATWVRDRTPRPERVRVVPNGVDPDRVRPPDRPADGPFTAGFVGSFKPWHGVDALLEAAAVLTDVRLLLVGDGPTREECERRAAAADLRGRVLFTGARTSEEVPALLQRMHVGVATAPPDAGNYFSPLKVLEYLAAGLPVVATRTPPLVELLREGTDAILVAPGDIDGLRTALISLRDNPHRRRLMGAEARRNALGHSWDAALDRVLASACARGVG